MDKKDWQLLQELDANSRQSYQQLGRKLKLSKDTIKYRIDNLKEEGIIKSFSAIVDIGKLGYTSFRLFIKLYNTTPEKEKEIIQYLLKNKNMPWLVQVEGYWDINTWFMYKDIKDMHTFLKKFHEKFSNHIADENFGIYAEVSTYDRAYLTDKKNKNKYPIITLPQKTNIDKKSYEILKILSKNARAHIVDIAQKTKLTSKTIIEKIKKLEKEKILVAYKTVFDLEKLNYNYYKIHLYTFNLTEEKQKQLKQYIFDHPNVIYYDDVLGGYNFEFEVQVKQDVALRKLINDIKERFGEIIKEYEVMHYYKEWRLSFFPLD